MRVSVIAAAGGEGENEGECRSCRGGGHRVPAFSTPPRAAFPPDDDSLVAEAIMVVATADIDCRRVAEGGGVQVATEDGGAVTGPSNLQEEMCK